MKKQSPRLLPLSEEGYVVFLADVFKSCFDEVLDVFWGLRDLAEVFVFVIEIGEVDVDERVFQRSVSHFALHVNDVLGLVVEHGSVEVS